MHIRKELFNDVKRQKDKIHIVLIGTKPDIIKQAPLISELKRRGHFTMVVHTGQHKQFNLSGGLEQEFKIDVDVNLGVSGNLYTQQSQIIARFGKLLSEIKDLRKEIIPYICADTTTAVAAGIASFSNLISTAHVEAGLRTMSPPKELILSLLSPRTNIRKYFDELRNKSKWKKGSYEPYPEQFDTRAAGPSAGIHFAPVNLNASHLIEEGYDQNRIFVVGNTISDSLSILAENKIKESKIIEKFPVLSKRDAIRFCVHRRENITSKQRFLAIYEAMETLIMEGRTIVLISLGATEWALTKYNLKKRTIELAKKYKNFVYSDVLPYYSDTIALMRSCILVPTDSGSIQEETNILGIPGVVLRFNSDRPEAVFSGSNVIAPPITRDVILKVIYGVLDDQRKRKEMSMAPKLYGKDVSKKIVDLIEKSTFRNSNFNIFDFMEHQRLGLEDKPFWRKGKTKW